jgi:formate-dependent nitrite reductase membrane component NrfD
LFGTLCFVIFAGLPLLLHLGRPERALNIMFNPNFTSAMAGFGYVYITFLIAVIIEIWFVVRPEIIEIINNSSGWKRKIFILIALGQYHPISEKTKKIDFKVIKIITIIGLFLVFILDGYVGFIFGSVKSNPWWSIALTPVSFLLSAVVSGIAVVSLLYIVVWYKKTIPNTLIALRNMLLITFFLDIGLEYLDLLTRAYKGGEEWSIVAETIGRKLEITYIYGQLGIFSFLPIILLLGTFSIKKVKTMKTVLIISSVLLLVQVFLLRWNTVIGGQYFSKSHRGILENIQMPFLGREGVIAGLLLLILPIIMLYLINKIFPIFLKRESPNGSTSVVPD